MDGKRIKQIIINGEVFDTSVDIFSPKVPVGAIVIWSGEAYNIPTGWHLCDGEDGTPDLRDKFVLGAGTNHLVGSKGGAETVALSVAQMPSHAHTYYRNTSTVKVATSTSSSASTVTTYTATSTSSSTSGSNQYHENMPPYYTLCYIMKVKPDATDSGGGTNFTTDDTLKMSEDNVLGVSLPVKEIGKEAYKSLTNAQKNENVLYITMDGGSEQEPPKDESKVYGVMWDSSNPSTALTRLTKDNDENGYVNTNITGNPVAAVGNEGGSSPFDALYPWADMEEYNITSSGKIYKRGQYGFSRTEYDTMVYIPEFWYKVVKNDDKWCWYISDKEKEGFEKHPGSGRYVGRYNTGADGKSQYGLYVSKSDFGPFTNITRAKAREEIHKKGDNWWQYDYATWCAVWLLYLVEFADWNSQKVIGQGIVNDTAAHNSGETDSMSYHTGRAAGEDGKTAVQYRHIENPWGNVYDWIDGINFYNREAYISLDNASFTDDTTSYYTSAGATLPSANGFISRIGESLSFPWSFLPISSNGDKSTYITDRVYSGVNLRVIASGGDWSDVSNAGLFYLYADYSPLDNGATISSRLLYIPKEV